MKCGSRESELQVRMGVNLVTLRAERQRATGCVAERREGNWRRAGKVFYENYGFRAYQV